MLYTSGTVFAAISQVYFLSFHKVFYMPLSYSLSLKLSILYFHFLRSPILFQHFPQSILPSSRKTHWLHIYCFCSSHIYHCTVSINCNLAGKRKKDAGHKDTNGDVYTSGTVCSHSQVFLSSQGFYMPYHILFSLNCNIYFHFYVLPSLPAFPQSIFIVAKHIGYIFTVFALTHIMYFQSTAIWQEK